MRYQFVINDLYNISNVSLIPYYMVMNHVQFLEQMLVGQQPIRFSRNNNICYIDMDWSLITSNEWLVLKCFGIIDPNEYPNVWQDRWLQDYASALVRKRWGSVLKVMSLPLAGGIKINGQEMYNDAVADIDKLRAELVRSFSIPAGLMIN
jgi:hypothetical protein